MSGEYFYGGQRKKPADTRPGKPSRPAPPRGTSTTGRIARLSIGQGHGYIRIRNAREVFFHRSDLADGTSFNDLQVSDAVTFELLEDGVSGARALHVARRSSTQ